MGSRIGQGVDKFITATSITIFMNVTKQLKVFSMIKVFIQLKK